MTIRLTVYDPLLRRNNVSSDWTSDSLVTNPMIDVQITELSFSWNTIIMLTLIKISNDFTIQDLWTARPKQEDITAE